MVKFYRDVNLVGHAIGRETYIKQKQLIEGKDGILYIQSKQCDHKASNFPELLSQIEKFKGRLPDKFYPYTVVKIMNCISTLSMLLSVPIQHAISILNIISDNTVQGSIYKGAVKNFQFVLKVLKDTYEAFHEIFIGLTCLNPLREIIPNFPYLYGYFYCSDLSLEKKELLKRSIPVIPPWCNHNEREIYIMYELITGQTFEKSLSSNLVGIRDYLSYLIQIIFSLELANKTCEYTHFDLHTGNVILRPLTKVQWIRYPIDGQQYYVKTSAIANIIDYGRNAVTVNGERYGVKVLDSNLPNYVAPMHDIYKFLCYSFAGSRGSLKTDILRIFNTVFGKRYSHDELQSKSIQGVWCEYSNAYTDSRGLMEIFNILRGMDTIKDILREIVVVNWSSLPKGAEIVCLDAYCIPETEKIQSAFTGKTIEVQKRSVVSDEKSPEHTVFREIITSQATMKENFVNNCLIWISRMILSKNMLINKAPFNIEKIIIGINPSSFAIEYDFLTGKWSAIDSKTAKTVINSTSDKVLREVCDYLAGLQKFSMLVRITVDREIPRNLDEINMPQFNMFKITKVLERDLILRFEKK